MSYVAVGQNGPVSGLRHAKNPAITSRHVTPKTENVFAGAVAVVGVWETEKERERERDRERERERERERLSSLSRLERVLCCSAVLTEEVFIFGVARAGFRACGFWS